MKCTSLALEREWNTTLELINQKKPQLDYTSSSSMKFDHSHSKEIPMIINHSDDNCSTAKTDL
jgi:hypothetical protein